MNHVNVVNPHQKHTVVIKKNTVGLRGIHHLSHLGFFFAFNPQENFFYYPISFYFISGED